MQATQERPVEGDPLWVDNPDVAEVLNLATGVTLSHREAIGTDYTKVLALRTALQAGIHNGSPHYVCSLCGTAVYLVSQATQRRFFFRHRPGAGGECAMLYGRLSQAEIDARKYNGVKESAAHRRMKEWLAQCLEADPHFSGVEVERRRTSQLTGEWRKPDVFARLGKLPIAFEVQLSTTYLNVIVARREFYRGQGCLLVWVFAHFDANSRRLAFDDIFFNNSLNALLITEQTVAASLKRREFVVECQWAESLSGTDISSLQRAVVPFHSLTLDPHNQRAFHFDYRSARYKPFRDRFEAFWTSHPSYEGLSPEKASVWHSLRAEARRQGFRLPVYPAKPPRALLNALYSAKLGRPVDWKLTTLVQVAHHVSRQHPEYLQVFRRALSVYERGDQLRREDSTGKWRAQVKVYMAAMGRGDSRFQPDRSFDDLVDALFPELGWERIEPALHHA